MTKITRKQKKSFRLLLNALKDAACYEEDVATILDELGYDVDDWQTLWNSINRATYECGEMLEQLDIEELPNGKRW